MPSEIALGYGGSGMLCYRHGRAMLAYFLDVKCPQPTCLRLWVSPIETRCRNAGIIKKTLQYGVWIRPMGWCASPNLLTNSKSRLDTPVIEIHGGLQNSSFVMLSPGLVVS